MSEAVSRNGPPSPRELVARCRTLSTPEEHRRLHFDLAAAFGDAEPEQVERRLGSLDTLRQAYGFLMLAARLQPPDSGRLLAALATRDEDLTAAAAFCFSVHCGQEMTVQRRLLRGPDEHRPPLVSEEARYHLVRCMGLSGESGFSQVLWELLEKQYHFFNARLVAEALERLGDPVPETEVERPDALRPLSIVALSSEAGIAVILDESFTGRSLCPSCRHFPCPINFRYRVGIEDCKLWNRTDPRTAGPIHDQRTKGRRFPRAGAKLPDIAVRAAAAEHAMALAEKLLADGPSREAIPPLCTVLIQAGHTSLLAPVAWVRLARCLEAHGDGSLARMAWREALMLRGVLGSSYVKESADLDAFAVAEVERRLISGSSFDRQSKTSGSTWFTMGEQHLAMGELALAELCIRRAARATEDSMLKERFTKKADEVRTRADQETTPGLAVERHRGAPGDES